MWICERAGGEGETAIAAKHLEGDRGQSCFSLIRDGLATMGDDSWHLVTSVPVDKTPTAASVAPMRGNTRWICPGSYGPFVQPPEKNKSLESNWFIWCSIAVHLF